MSDWEDDDWNAPGEAQASEALGDWDDEDKDRGGGAAAAKEEAAANKPSAPMRPKKALAKALKQREEEERAKEAAALKAREQELESMSAVERKLKLQEIEEAADIENAKDLFSGGNFKAGKSAPPSTKATIDTFQPTTDADFEKLAAMLGQRLCPFNNNPRRTGRYVQFLKHVFRSLTADLNADDTNDLSTFLGVVSNEKRDEQKRLRGVKKKGNKKAVVKVDRADDMRSDRFDDFADDFM